MNWLAHLLLSEPTPEFRLGNLIPDLLPKPQWGALPAPVQRGIACHRLIDAYTDAHPLVRRSIARVATGAPQLGRFGGVLVDVFYDHLLLTHWSDYSGQAFGEFEAAVYAAIDEAHWLPGEAQARLSRMRAHRWLAGYARMEGVAATLQRIGAHLRRPQDLGAGVTLLQQHGADFLADFRGFFPALQTRVAQAYALPRTLDPALDPALTPHPSARQLP